MRTVPDLGALWTPLHGRSERQGSRLDGQSGVARAGTISRFGSKAMFQGERVVGRLRAVNEDARKVETAGGGGWGTLGSVDP